MGQSPFIYLYYSFEKSELQTRQAFFIICVSAKRLNFVLAFALTCLGYFYLEAQFYMINLNKNEDYIYGNDVIFKSGSFGRSTT